VRADVRDKKVEVKVDVNPVWEPYHRDCDSRQQTAGSREQAAGSKQQQTGDSKVSYRRGEPVLSRALPVVSKHQINMFKLARNIKQI
jgi:hypothetical protein